MTAWLWFGTAGMSVGALVFLVLGRGARGGSQDVFMVTFFVAAVAATAYLAMALDQGRTMIDGREVFYARYVDWLITTPLLLIDLAILVRASRSLTTWLVGLDVYMIGTGLIAGLTSGGKRYVWFAVSSVAFVAIVGILVGRFLALARDGGTETSRTFTRLAGLTVGLWSLYPVVWLLGTEGTGAVGLTTEVAMFAVLDLLAKIGFGVILLTSRAIRQRDRTDASAPTSHEFPALA
jgi:bacteriorhodopsin